MKNLGGQGGLGGLDGLFRQAQKLQQDMKRVQDELAKRVVEGSAGGAVKAFVNGKMHLVKLEIPKEVVDPQDVELLEDMVVAAYADGARKAQAMVESEMAKLTGGIAIPGMGGLL